MTRSERQGGLWLKILGCSVQIDCTDFDALELIRASYGPMRSDKSSLPDLAYRISPAAAGSGYGILPRGREALFAADTADLLFLLEKDLTIELQKLRRDLYFVHAAALALSGRAVLLVAESGRGKSTTSWGLLQHGFGYLSDELAPLDLPSLKVQPYPRAVCLKAEPPFPYGLPAQALRTSSTLHIPVALFAHGAVMEPTPLSAIFFIEYFAALKFPAAHRISPAEATARLFAQALNPLAHADEGLAGAISVVKTVPSYRLAAADLGLTCELIKQTLADPSRAEAHPAPQPIISCRYDEPSAH